MSPVFVVIADIIEEDSFEVALVQGDDMVKQVTPAGTHPALGNAVLPGALQGGLNASDFHRLNGYGYVEPVLPIVIKYEKLGCGLEGKCFSQLLDNPDAGRMASDIEVKDAPPVMADDEEAVENAKSDRRDREEVHRCDRLAVISQEGQPASRRLWISECTLHPPGDGSLRELEAQHEKFAVDARSTPGRVLGNHLENQISDFFGESSSTNLLSHPGDEASVQTKSASVPTNHGLRGDHEERLLPGGPKLAREYPEELIERSELGSRVPALQDGELLSKRQILKEQALP
jgi:hypothetical protein